MNIELLLYIVSFMAVLTVVTVVRIWIKKTQEARCLDRYNSISNSSIQIPPTLHPVFDSTRCIGSGACTRACPQGTDVIGRIQGRGVLIDPSMCIGHGRCAQECPVGAIRLVFGSAERGVDIPQLSPKFETNVGGMYITGELGGMGLIANAIRQATEGMENIAETLKTEMTVPSTDKLVDVAIVGAGPAGLTSALYATQHGLSYRLFDKESEVGGAVRQYPRNKIVMTHPMQLPLVGKIHATTMTKELLIKRFQNWVSSYGITIAANERVTDIERHDNGTFTVHSNKTSVHARKVMLAIGRRGIPRKLGVPGEQQSHVSYSIAEPDPFIGRNVLVVGGGDSAVETACMLAPLKDTHVTLSYRGQSLSRVKPANQEQFSKLVSAHKIQPLFNSNVRQIKEAHTVLDVDGTEQTIVTDDVIIQIGGELPTALLQHFGIFIERHFGEETEHHRHEDDEIKLFNRIRNQQRSKGLQNFHNANAGLPIWLKWCLGMLSVAVITGLFYIGKDYYLTAEVQRRNNDLLQFYSASGTYGHSLGILAGAFIVLNLFYFIRKEFRFMSGVGNIQAWMFFHQISGLLAAAIVLLHTGLVLYNAFALSLYLSMGIVVFTGIVGRYFFVMVPVDPRGRPLTHEALTSLSARMKQRYQDSYGALNAAIKIVKILDTSYQPNHPWPKLLFRLFTIWPYRYIQLMRIVHHAGHEIPQKTNWMVFKNYSIEMARLRLQIELAPRIKGVLRLWRSTHALLAIMTATLVIVHVVIEVWVGYGT